VLGCDCNRGGFKDRGDTYEKSLESGESAYSSIYSPTDRFLLYGIFLIFIGTKMKLKKLEYLSRSGADTIRDMSKRVCFN
jgi:hypothetical protein